MSTSTDGRNVQGVPQDFRMKWRPHRFHEFWNFSHSRTLQKLERQMQNGNLPQLSIYHGTFSSGKTSAAYILGMWASCCNWRTGAPCGTCYGCRAVQNVSLDAQRGGFIELDGTSSTIAEDLQNIISQTRDARKKNIFEMFDPEVTWRDDWPYIVAVDEAHRMTPKTQESLLKLVERLATAKVVLITTELEKIEGGLISRATPYRFVQPTPAQAAPHLVRIAQAEGICLQQEAAAWIAEQKAGRPRDCLGALWELRGIAEVVTLAKAKELLADEETLADDADGDGSFGW